MKECSCLTHDGPHYLHMDAIWKEANHRLLQQAIRYEQARDYYNLLATLHCYDQAELRRLQEIEAALREEERHATSR